MIIMTRHVLTSLILTFAIATPAAALDPSLVTLTDTDSLLQDFARQYPDGFFSVCEHAQNGTVTCKSTSSTASTTEAQNRTDLSTAIVMQNRVCPRVQNRFSSDVKMWQRVNDRIENRFGFRCQQLVSSLEDALKSLRTPYDPTLVGERGKLVDEAIARLSEFDYKVKDCAEDVTQLKRRLTDRHNEYIQYLHDERNLDSNSAKKNIEYLKRNIQRLFDELPRSCV